MPIERAKFYMLTSQIAKEAASWSHEGAIFAALGKTQPLRNDIVKRFTTKITEILEEIAAECAS